MVYKVTTVYITGNAFLWSTEGRIPVLKKSWLFPRECISKHRFANSVPCGNRLCVSSLTVFTRAANPALKTILIHLQQSLLLPKCHSLVAYTSQPCHTGQFPKDGNLLSLLYGGHICILQPTVFLVLVFVSSFPVCLGKWLSTETVH